MMLRVLLMGSVAAPLAVAVSQNPQRATVRDSAGIRIVQNGVIANLPAALRVDSAYSVDLGGLRDKIEEEFNDRNPFKEARRMSDGRFVAVDLNALKVFSAEGKYLATIGRQGEGPGEFGQVRAVCILPGDTIVAINYNRPRISVFDKTGKHVKTVDVRGRAQPYGCFPDGSLVFSASAIPNPSSRMAADRAAVFDLVSPSERVRWDGTTLGSIGSYPAESREYSFQDVGNFVVSGNRIVAGNGAAPEYRVYSQTGELEQIVRWTAPQKEITRDMQEANARRSIPNNTPPDEVARRIAQTMSRPQRDRVPAYSLIRVDMEGRVWVQDDFQSPTPWGWTIFNSSGQLLGRVMFPQINPPRTRVEIGGWGPQQVFLGWRDADGTSHLTIHRIR